MVAFVCVLIGVSQAITDRVDLIELNRILDDSGNVRIEQVILWEWSPEFRRYDVVAWRLVDGDVMRLPYRLPSGEWCFRWHEPAARITREVRAKNYQETKTRHDPEIANQSLHRCRSLLRKK